MREKSISVYQIKKKYLRKLSIELIKRGASNNNVKTLLDDVSLSIDDYIAEFKPRDLDELEHKFGSPEDFCDNNAIVSSKIASIGQLSLIVFMLCSVLLVPILSIVSLFTISVYPNASDFTLSLPNSFMLGIDGVNTGYGIIGTILGLNIFIWLLYSYFKDKFSSYDVRDAIKGIILVLYWYLVVFCLYLILDSYISHYIVIQEMWNQNMGGLILEGIFRWISLESVLIVTAILYTNKYIKQYYKKKDIIQQNFIIDKIGTIVVVFALTGFISAGPGMGLLLLAIGVGVFFLTRFTSKTWLVGLVAILLHLGALLTQMFEVSNSNQYTRSLIIVGIETRNINDYEIFIAFLILCLAIVWSVICVRKLKKIGYMLLPRLRIPRRKNAWISIGLVIISLVAVLGTQPRKTLLYGSNFNYSEEISYWEFDCSFEFQRAGKLAISLYTFIEETRSEEHTHHLTGSWYLMWTPTGSFRTFRVDGNFDNYTTPSYSGNIHTGHTQVNVSIKFISLTINGSGVLRYHFTMYKENMTMFFPYPQIQYSAVIPWLPNWYDIVIFVCVITFLFLEGDEKALQLLSKNKEGDK